MRKILLLSAGALALAGCADDGDRRPPPHPWAMTRQHDEIDYELLDRVLFPTDSADIGPRAYDAIADIAQDIRAHPRRPVEVDGYTDTTGDHQHNLDLSRARADAVADVLTHQGVAGSRIHTHGFGETHLAVPTGNNVSEPRNRRVVVRILMEH